ncbi:MAG: peroxidase-related enzyme [Chitinophagaceae bacterium]
MANIKVIPYEEATGELKDIYEDLIEKRGKLAAVHTIQSLNPDSIIAHMELYMTIMFSHSPLTRAQREMMAVVVSSANGCKYCQLHHGAALNNYWKKEERVLRLRRNYETAGLNENDALLCRFAIELTLHPEYFEDNNRTVGLHQAGFNDRAILDATLVIAYFNFVNRMVMALGVEAEDKAGEGYNY